MPTYETYPAVDEQYSFNPLVRQAIANSSEVKAAVTNELTVQVRGAVTDSLNEDPTIRQMASDALDQAIAEKGDGLLIKQQVESLSESSGVPLITNLAINSGPDDGSPTWPKSYGTNGEGTASFSNASSPSGKAVRMTWTKAPTGRNGSVATPATSPVTPGKTYSGSVLVRIYRENVLGAVIRFYDSSGNSVGDTYYNRLIQVPTGNIWTKLEVTGAVAPAGAVTAQVGWALGVTGGTHFQVGDWVDSACAMLVEGSYVPTWFNGGSANAYWVGEPIISPSIGVDISYDLGRKYSAAPQYAGTKNGLMRLDQPLYLPKGSSIEPMRDGIRSALQGISKYHLVAAGHSIVAGQGARPGRTDWPRLFQMISAGLGKSTPGIIVGDNNTTDDSRLSYDPEWVDRGSPRGDMQQHLWTMTSGKSVTFTFDHAGTVAEIYTFGNSAQLGYQIDGGAQVLINPTGQNLGQITRVTGLSNDRHTIKVTSMTDSNSYILGCALTNPTGLVVTNSGYSGSIAYDWRPGGSFYSGFRNLTETMNANGAIVQVEANALIHSVGVSDLLTYLNSMIEGLRQRGTDVLLVVDPPMTDYKWIKDYLPAIYSIADTNSVPMLDLTALMLSRDLAEEEGLFADNYHPNSKGYHVIADAFAKALLSD